MSVRIGPCRIADRTGTHEPGAVIDFPSADLVELANSGATDPESGERYAEIVGAPKAAAGKGKKSDPEPEPEPETEPAPEPEPELPS